MNNLLLNQNLSCDELNHLVDKILEFEKWRVERELENNLRVAEITSITKRQYIRASDQTSEDGGEGESASGGFTEEDVTINDLSSYGFCRDQHLGKISKTKIWEAANMKATDLLPRWKAHIEEKNCLPLKELNERRLRTLLLNFLWAHGCAQRILQWPNAPDMDGVKGLKADLTARLNKYPRIAIVTGYESLKVFWNEINDYNIVPFNSTLIAEILDNAEEEVRASKAVLITKDIKQSPLFIEFQKQFPNGPDLEYLEKYFIKSRGDFVKAGVMALRRHYSSRVPEEVTEKYDLDKWMKQWHIFLPPFLEEWTKRLRNIKFSNITEQKQWEST